MNLRHELGDKFNYIRIDVANVCNNEMLTHEASRTQYYYIEQ